MILIQIAVVSVDYNFTWLFNIDYWFFMIIIVCALSCPTGYIPDSNCFECILDDACEAFTPCQNGGTCILDIAPDQFSCVCTNSYDPDTNCSGKYRE